MSTKDDGGPAFPYGVQYEIRDYYGNSQVQNEVEGGMTLRDYFAAKALVGLIAEPVEGVQEAVAYELSDSTCEVFAQAAYKFADAMLKARAA
jgi:hypothetical protein